MQDSNNPRRRQSINFGLDSPTLVNNPMTPTIHEDDEDVTPRASVQFTHSMTNAETLVGSPDATTRMPFMVSPQVTSQDSALQGTPEVVMRATLAGPAQGIMAFTPEGSPAHTVQAASGDVPKGAPMTTPEGNPGGADQAAPGEPMDTATQTRRRSFVPSVAVTIPNAIERIRLPVRLGDGLLVMTGSRAPVTMEEANQLEKIEVKEEQRKKKYRRQKQAFRRWMSETGRESGPVGDGGEQARQGGGNWARKSLGRVRDMMNAGRGRDGLLDRRYMENLAEGQEDDVRVGNSMMLAEEEQIPEFHKHVMQPFAGQYLHTTAALAYEEGRKSSPYELGFKAGIERVRQEHDYAAGYQDGLQSYQSSPTSQAHRSAPTPNPLATTTSSFSPPNASVQASAPQRAQSPTGPTIFRPDGSVVFRSELMEQINIMMDNLDIARVDEDTQTVDVKGKGKAQPRTIPEMCEFIKNVNREMKKLEE